MNASWWLEPVQAVDESYAQAARKRQAQLTKPPGSLGELETIAIRLCGLQRCDRPHIERAHITVFAADHGVAEEGVSAFPQAVTVEMLRNFARGGAAISVLARALNATLEVVNVGTVGNPGPLPGVIDNRIAAGTANFFHARAMSEAQLAAALQAGAESVERAHGQHADIFIGGEMGIANTTSATAVACALLNAAASRLSGPGTGLDNAGIQHKARVIDQALASQRFSADDSLDILRCFGGFEIAALTGAYLRCAQLAMPVLVDGYIASVAALCALQVQTKASVWFFYGHHSAEPGHRLVMEKIAARPLLQLGMRLGEGSGAAAALPLMRLACALHNQMATFAEAGVSEAL
ncbi:MAG: nicotinate-nucleotide--dimethylbenzimidazole phosphoribosyltransferase [Gammaproteobacteria bacterium]|nr:nicotinate-nucleotide--dimethylbenzimidazole phosphoribosyltransferase [Gammaproteobacteria bacterium]